jgi:hypothetical protein
VDIFLPFHILAFYVEASLTKKLKMATTDGKLPTTAHENSTTWKMFQRTLFDNFASAVSTNLCWARSIFVRLLFDFCSTFVRLLFDFCSTFVRLLFDLCSTFVRLLLDLCLTFVQILFYFRSIAIHRVYHLNTWTWGHHCIETSCST